MPGTAVYQPLKTEIFNHKMNSWAFSLLFLNVMCSSIGLAVLG